MVGSAVATIVWSSAATAIASINPTYTPDLAVVGLERFGGLQERAQLRVEVGHRPSFGVVGGTGGTAAAAHWRAGRRRVALSGAGRVVTSRDHRGSRRP